MIYLAVGWLSTFPAWSQEAHSHIPYFFICTADWASLSKHPEQAGWTVVMNTQRQRDEERGDYFSQHRPSPLPVRRMATGIRKASFFQLLWEKNNQEMSPTQGKAVS